MSAEIQERLGENGGTISIEIVQKAILPKIS